MNISNHTQFQAEALAFNGPDGKAFLTLIVKGTFDFCKDSPAPISAEQIPIAFGDEFYNERLM
jgi:hypothetical protein